MTSHLPKFLVILHPRWFPHFRLRFFASFATMGKKVEEAEFKLETAPFDPRFPNMNQTKYCYQSYIDYHRCRKIKGESYKPCEYFFKVYNSMCPFAWVEKWDDQLSNGNFAGKI